MLTLHLYLGRELIKTFLMTAIALTLLVVMGGGVANIFRSEGIGAEGMAKVFMLMTPVAITMIMPVAALFSAAITYGRAGADNEILACSAAGINIHRILLPALLLGVFVTGYTYWSWNYFIPGLWRQVAQLSRMDAPTIVTSNLKKAKPLTYGRYTISARTCRVIPPEEIEFEDEGDTSPNEYTWIELTGVSFCETEQQDAIRFGTSELAIIQFDNSGPNPRAKVGLEDVRTFDAQRRQYYQLRNQTIGPIDIPFPINRRTKFENLNRLIEFTHDPMLIPEVMDRMHGLRRQAMIHLLKEDIQAHLDTSRGGTGVYLLAGDKVRYEIKVGGGNSDPDDGRTFLHDVTIVERGKQGGQIHTADKATVELRSGLNRDRPVILITLQENVVSVPDPAGPDDRPVLKVKETLQPMQLMDQPSLRKAVKRYDFDRILDPDVDLTYHTRFVKLRERCLERKEELVSEVRGEIHFRASYSLAAVAVVLFGAILGIIVRGREVLTAFGISCLPLIFVLVWSIVGRNLADRPEFSLLSTSVMWGATAFMYAAALFVGFKVLRR
jgi:lipopolysaccharide export LptBFGC system permease protein LptF